ncbi:LacI family DNA-binding transcriptional regulator [Marinicrinis sediminis]|uniref:LacI family DNA-binding transcriptional regulator n=1 Tax=Marinicrinis sediminis TaxID=1652465 RepID=A0ABW5RFG8_9BACL
MSVTIKDVARAAGVSPSTVSRVITKHSTVNKLTAQKVRKIMEELEYHPNIIAQSLVSKSTSTIGVLFPKTAEQLYMNLFFIEVIRGIFSETTASMYDVLTTTGATIDEELQATMNLVRGKRVDGLILLQSRVNDPIIQFLQAEGFPFVLIGRHVQDDSLLSVDNDNVKACYDAVKHMVEQGHERIAFVNGPSDLVVCKDRQAGYEQGLKDAGLPIRDDYTLDGSQFSSFQAVSTFMSLPERPTALIVQDDLMCMDLIRTFKEMHIRVPEDMAMISFNKMSIGGLVNPTLSNIDIDIFQLGKTAVELLVKQIRSEKIEQCRWIVPHQILSRQSSVLGSS